MLLPSCHHPSMCFATLIAHLLLITNSSPHINNHRTPPVTTITLSTNVSSLCIPPTKFHHVRFTRLLISVQSSTHSSPPT
mmetsp:Transcript_15662/g.24371  ORF Transcript_15662/g.24371 Transcript_15662/m.24371 type:complete len:80 (-) Transcript_15662:162-401(-)